MSELSADTLDPADVVARLFRPQRPALASALECVYAMPEALAREAAQGGLVWDERGGWLRWSDEQGAEQRFRTDRGHFDAEQAWEAVVSHGLVNDSWIADPARLFVTVALHRALLGKDMAPRRSAFPHTLKACVLAASDARALETVETLVRAAVSALEPWGQGAQPHTVLWQFDELPAYQRNWVDPLMVEAERRPEFEPERDPWRNPVAVRNNAAIVRASRALGPPRDGLAKGPTNAGSSPFLAKYSRVAFALAADAQRWDVAAREGALVRVAADDPGFPVALDGLALSKLSNPFAPLATVFALGYGIRALNDDAHLIALEP
ncbi:MAG: hypothetical protein U0269_02855 [Polyangiales bacterium]